MSFTALVARYGLRRSEPDAAGIASTISNPTQCHAVIAAFAFSSGRTYGVFHA